MNNSSPTSLSVCVQEHVACVRVVGRANFTSSIDFKRLMQQLQDDGCQEIILDLGECRLMDSTFLGVLAGIASRCEEGRANGRAVCIELFQPSGRVTELLENLGVLDLFKRIEQTPAFDCFQPVQEGRDSKLDLNRTCLEAHQTLMNTSAENERRFRDATEFFRKNLEESEGKE